MTSELTNTTKPAIPVWARILLFIIAFFIVSGVFQIIGVLLSGIPFSELSKVSEQGTAVLFIFQLWSLIPLLFVVYVFRKSIDKQSILSLGFSIKNRGTDLFFGLIAAIILIGGGSFLLLALGVTDFSYSYIDFKMLALSFLLFIVVALNEEIMVRGYILNNLLSVTNKYLALFISALLFTAMHGFNSGLSWIAIINLFLAGIILGSTYIFTKNLWFPISLHLFWNFLQGPVLGYNVSGQKIESVFTVQLHGNQMLNGGEFGFEGSLVCTALSVFVIVGVLFFFERKQTATLEIQNAVKL